MSVSRYLYIRARQPFTARLFCTSCMNTFQQSPQHVRHGEQAQSHRFHSDSKTPSKVPAQLNFPKHSQRNFPSPSMSENLLKSVTHQLQPIRNLVRPATSRWQPVRNKLDPFSVTNQFQPVRNLLVPISQADKVTVSQISDELKVAVESSLAWLR